MDDCLLIAGVDEAGRGPLAGPVVAAAVILPAEYTITGLTDSKKISERKREHLYTQIIEQSIAYGVGQASVEEIDEINILQATFRAMQRAVDKLLVKPEQIVVDGNQCPEFPYPAYAVVKGDQRVDAISAASVIAKVTRDRIMYDWDKQYPQYGFGQHKGYGTALHRAAIQAHGTCKIHRHSFTLLPDFEEV